MQTSTFKRHRNEGFSGTGAFLPFISMAGVSWGVCWGFCKVERMGRNLQPHASPSAVPLALTATALPPERLAAGRPTILNAAFQNGGNSQCSLIPGCSQIGMNKKMFISIEEKSWDPSQGPFGNLSCRSRHHGYHLSILYHKCSYTAHKVMSAQTTIFLNPTVATSAPLPQFLHGANLERRCRNWHCLPLSGGSQRSKRIPVYASEWPRSMEQGPSGAI
nr:hypothetical protein CFP56_11544 [Quercus suber]